MVSDAPQGIFFRIWVHSQQKTCYFLVQIVLHAHSFSQSHPIRQVNFFSHHILYVKFLNFFTYSSDLKIVYVIFFTYIRLKKSAGLDIYTRTGWHRNWPKSVKFRNTISIGSAHRGVKWLHEPTRKLVLYGISICIYHDINFHLTRLMTSQDQFWKLILAEFFTSS